MCGLVLPTVHDKCPPARTFVTDGVGCLEDFMDTAEKAPLTQLLLNEDYCDSNNGCSWQDHCENSEVCNWEGVETGTG